MKTKKNELKKLKFFYKITESYTYPHANLVVGVAVAGDAVRHRIQYVNLEEVGRLGVGVIKGLLLGGQTAQRFAVN